MRLVVRYERRGGGMIRWSVWKPATLTEMEAQVAKANGMEPLEQLGHGHASSVTKAKEGAKKFADRWGKKHKLRRMP